MSRTTAARLEVPAVGTRLEGRVLALSRAAWLVVALLTLVHFAAGLPSLFARFQAECADCLLRPSTVDELRALGLSPVLFAGYLTALALVFGLGFFVVGGAIFSRRSDDPAALVVALALVTFGGTAFGGPPDQLTAMSSVWQVLATMIYFVGRASLLLFFSLFPDGRFVPRWMAGPAVAGIVLVGWVTFAPDLPLSRWLLSPGIALFAVLLALGPCAQFYRYARVSGPVQRRQTKWAVLGMATAVVVQGVTWAAFATLGVHVVLVLLGNFLLTAAFLLIPLSVGVAILRHQLFNIDLLLNRAIVYGALSACVVGVYAVLVGAFGGILRGWGDPIVPIVATGVSAVLLQPLRSWLQRGVNRLLYGQRDEPYAVIAQLGRRLEETPAPDAALPAVVEVVARTLKLPYAAIALRNGNQSDFLAASYGVPRGDMLRLPLVHQSVALGELILCSRLPGEPWTAADLGLLQELARQAGAAVHAAQVTAELQRSRARLVTALEEERRRLRRDLHDGVGPTLAALALKAEAAFGAARDAPAESEALLADVVAQAQGAIAEIRRVVYGLRPPALDELGLLAVVRARAMQYAQVGLRVALDLPEGLPALPAAVEVAAYRILQEALNNVVRHAEAQSCRVRVKLDAGALHVEVTDDGRGLAASRTAGIGLGSMHERAAELGGVCRVESGQPRGTRVWAMLPFQSHEGADGRIVATRRASGAMQQEA